MIFVDTSAIFALLAGSDDAHDAAVRIFDRTSDRAWVSHDFVLAESLGLVQHRLGSAAVTALIDGLLPLIDFSPVSRELRDAALSEHRRRARSRYSFVDTTSFEFMRSRGISDVFAFDDDFKRAGFTLCKP